MKKATTIIFGFIGLVFGLVFTSIKISASQVIYPSSVYWAQQDGNDISILAPELPNSVAGRLNFDDFVEDWSYYYTNDLKYAFIIIQPVKISYNDNNNNYIYEGYIDQIAIFNNTLNDFIAIEFYYQGSPISSYGINNFFGVLTTTFNIINSVEQEYGDIKYESGYRFGYNAGRTVGLEEGQLGSEELYNKAYKIGYEEAKKYYYQLGYTEGYELISKVEFEKGFQHGVNDGYNNGYNKGYQDGVSTVYENGFSGLINPDTNSLYDQTASFPYGKGYQDGFTSTEEGGLWNVVFSAILAPFQVLEIELMPGVTMGMIFAVPLVFGLLAWMLSVGKSKK